MRHDPTTTYVDEKTIEKLSSYTILTHRVDGAGKIVLRVGPPKSVKPGDIRPDYQDFVASPSSIKSRKTLIRDMSYGLLMLAHVGDTHFARPGDPKSQFRITESWLRKNRWILLKDACESPVLLSLQKKLLGQLKSILDSKLSAKEVAAKTEAVGVMRELILDTQRRYGYSLEEIQDLFCSTLDSVTIENVLNS